MLSATLDGTVSRVRVVRRGAEFTVFGDGVAHRLVYRDMLAPQAEEEIAGGRLTAPMPGKIIQVLAAAQATVRRGQGLIVLEAMKMEHTVSAPADGVVERVNYAVGDLVEEGAELIVFALPAGAKGS
jgi:3-methylcrotonyl-CoA carboxylase alpha subunit